MSIESIAIKNLIVNPANDRHGETASESDAINWLLEKHEEHMKALAKDIAAEGRLYEYPLVSKFNGKYLVFDGNRRITCLKLMKEPQLSPDDKWRRFFTNIVSGALKSLPNEVECHVEGDSDVIDEILYRRHTGIQNGVGQTGWNDRAKANFINRTGKKKRNSIAAEIEKLLKKEGALQPDQFLPLANLDRLLSNQKLQQRLGLILDESGIILTHEKTIVLKALKRVAWDMINHDITLVDLWKNTTKERYLDRLETEGVLPKTEHALPIKKDTPEISPPKITRPKPAPRLEPLYNPTTRENLIPASLQLEFPANATRIRAIWIELKFDLVFKKHSNSIAVLFRVLLELSIDHCIKAENISHINPNDHLRTKVRKVAEHFEKNRRIDSKYLAQMKRFGQDDELISSASMNAYVHSANFSPSPEHLKAIWDGMQLFILECLRH